MKPKRLWTHGIGIAFGLAGGLFGLKGAFVVMILFWVVGIVFALRANKT